MTHPLHANDDVGRIAHDLALWVYSLAAAIAVVQGRDRSREDRAEALAKVFEVWPKICRRMPELERAAPNSFARGNEADQRMQDVLEGVQTINQPQHSTGGR